MPGLGETVAVIDKSGKVVSTSKHLFGVFKEARSAYKERKAEIKAEKQSRRAEREVLEAQRSLAEYSLEEPRPVREALSKKKPARSKSATRQGDRAHSNRHRRSSYQYDQDLHSTTSRRHRHHDLARRHSYVADGQPQRLHRGMRSHTVPNVDLDLAYGEFHPPSLQADDSDEEELSGLVANVRRTLEEADCAHHSVTAIIAHLQKHPDAMAAVALTLAEISNLVTKMAPAALTAIKSSAPAVFALLSSPQFMVAAGVGLGVTVVALGGYKIVKQIKSAKENRDNEESMDEMVELNTRLSKIENWRRGVADSEAESVGTSVDGEFITPTAASMSRMHLPTRVDELREEEEQGSVRNGGGSQYSRRSKMSRQSRASKQAKSVSSRQTSKSDKKKKEKEKKDKEKPKKSSPLRILLKH